MTRLSILLAMTACAAVSATKLALTKDGPEVTDRDGGLGAALAADAQKKGMTCKCNWHGVIKNRKIVRKEVRCEKSGLIGWRGVWCIVKDKDANCTDFRDGKLQPAKKAWGGRAYAKGPCGGKESVTPYEG